MHHFSNEAAGGVSPRFWKSKRASPSRWAFVTRGGSTRQVRSIVCFVGDLELIEMDPILQTSALGADVCSDIDNLLSLGVIAGFDA